MHACSGKITSVPHARTLADKKVERRKTIIIRNRVKQYVPKLHLGNIKI